MGDTDSRVSRLPTIRVPSDDCAIMMGQVIEDGKVVEEGEAYYVHTGEWVELIPVHSIKEQLALTSIMGAADYLNEGTEDDTPEQAKAKADAFMVFRQSQNASMTALSEELAKRVIRWSWTDALTGEPLPQPHKRPDVIQGLYDEEFLWLLTASKGESSSERKNGFTPSETTSLTERVEQPSPLQH